MANGANAVQRTCDGGADRLWRAVAEADGSYTLVNVGSGRCLDVYQGRATDGARIVQWDCWGGANQKWILVSNANGTTTFRSAATSKCVDDYNWSTAENAQLPEWSCSYYEVQQFVVQ